MGFFYPETHQLIPIKRMGTNNSLLVRTLRTIRPQNPLDMEASVCPQSLGNVVHPLAPHNERHKEKFRDVIARLICGSCESLKAIMRLHAVIPNFAESKQNSYRVPSF